MQRLSLAGRAAVLTILAASIVASPVAAHASSDEVPVKRWVLRVCAAIEPSAQSAVSDAREWPTASVAPATLNDIVDRVDTADRALAGLIGVLRAMREGMSQAGTPAVVDGRQVVAGTQRTIRKVEVHFGEARDAIGRFQREFDIDPGSAMDELSVVFGGGLKLDLPAVHWPGRLSSAFDRSPRCDDVRQMLDEFVSLVRRKIGG